MTIPIPTASAGTTTNRPPPSGPPSSGKRLIELDILRGFLLFWMTLTHLPTKANVISNQTFGFVSAAEGFIFLAAFMIGQLEQRVEQRKGLIAVGKDVFRRNFRIYLYHCGLLAIAFTLVAQFGKTFHRAALQNLLSFYIDKPKEAIVSALLLEYRPSLLDILPMYIVFMLITPLVRRVAQRWGWTPLLLVSSAIWLAAQFGLRGWLYRQGDIFGLSVPETSTGSFDLYGWQLIWMVGLALGTIVMKRQQPLRIPQWLLITSCVLAVILLVLRYSPVDHWMNPEIYGRLIDKWHLGLVRIINFSLLAIILIHFGARIIAALPFLRPFALLGQASLEVFSIHVLCCIAAVSLNKDADPQLEIWQQAIVLPVTISILFLTAYLFRKKPKVLPAT